MNLTSSSIKYNRVAYMVLLVIVIMGALAYNKLSRDSMPPYTIRAASIVTVFPGAGPERVESLISDKIEKVAQEIPEVKTITSESRTGLSVVTVSLTDDIPQADLRPIWDRLRRKIDVLTPTLPDGITGPTVNDDNLGVVFGIVLGLQNEGFSYKELKDYSDFIKDELIRLEGASQIEVAGLQEERVYVEFDNTELARYNLSSGQLQNIIATTNIIFPGGDVSLNDKRVILEPTGNFETLNDLRNMLVPVGGGETVALGNITTIRKDYVSPVDQLVKIDGERGISISIALKEGANIIELGEKVNARVIELNKELPVGLTLNRISSQDYEVDKSVKDFVSNLLQSVGIVLVVMFLFLGFRTGFVVASLIPMAIILTLFLMDFFTIGLNQVSLAALIMALGMLVDNAIVMAESIMVKMEEGNSAVDSAVQSSSELMVPLLISSLTTSAAFLAFFLAESIMGEIVGPLFSVITIALLSSWLLSLTLIPLLAVAVIKIKKVKAGSEKTSIFDRFRTHYKGWLMVVLKRRLLFLVIIVGLFFTAIFSFGNIPFIFFPDSERNLVTLDLNLPLGTKIERTTETVAIIEEYIQQELLVDEEREKGITGWSSFIGKGPSSYDLGYQPGEANSGYAHMLLNTSSGADNEYVIAQLDEFAFNNLPNAEVKVKKLGGGGGGVPVEVRISGPEAEYLTGLAEQVKEKLINIKGAKNVSDDWGPKIIKLVVDIDPVRAREVGLTNQDIAISLRTVLSGFNVGEFREEDNSIPIVMRDEVNQDQTINSLQTLTIFSQSSGKQVPLAQVAKIRSDWQFAKIKRKDLSRTISVTAFLEADYTATEITEVLNPWLEENSKNWESSYSYELGGEAQSSSEGMKAVSDKLPLSGFIILLLLILQFNSIRKTALVLSTVPLGIIGVVFGLIVAQSYFSFFAFLGIISLAGIVINNAIVLIDRINIENLNVNQSHSEAVVNAALHRFRPILLTTATTTFGLLPLWFGGGIMWEPMAVSIIFGLLFATVITLFFIPVLYSLLFRIKY